MAQTDTSVAASIDYNLPQDRIALYPKQPRDACRLMVVSLPSVRVRHAVFRDLIDYLEPGDALAVNDSRVINARITGRKSSGGKVEFLLLERAGGYWRALGRPAVRLKEDMEIMVRKNGQSCSVKIKEKRPGGSFLIDAPDNILEYGFIPLPPYIGSKRSVMEEDYDDYQTVFSQHEGSVASSTAGLHFTPGFAEEIKAKGINIIPVTLHVGPGTFRPSSRPGAERYSLSGPSAAGLDDARRICVCGTTVMRALETAYDGSRFKHGPGVTELYIEPGYKFRVPGSFVTNFHLPNTPLLSMVAAYIDRFLPGRGVETLKRIYEEALAGPYMFLSYGDAMLFIDETAI
ncbi:MAG: S-adenosylmethionine:tRNA ribosyltransferase-isomerase [Elusimicrobia bacterium]|nr:S-adenosylmethionine:tRNA ribosyltransferase-isomerase [Elusimicrobiota bacterium]